jgi:phosphate transport system protein
LLRVDFHEALESTRLELIKLGALTLDALRHALKAFQEGDTALAGRIIADDQLEPLRRRIEAACIELLWRQQPVAGELREVTGMHEIATDLGIVIGLVNEIAKQAIRAAGTTKCPDSSEVRKVAQLTETMLRDALQSFEKRDANLATTAYDRADQVEDFYSPVVDEIQNYMQEHPDSVACGVSLLFELTALQRIAERAESIAWHTDEML